ncbi:hypothetical protein JCM3766R1_006448 [Sporobolomyces carnicolor]
MQAVRIAFYTLAILSAIVTWCLAAAFLALTHAHLDQFWRGDVALLVFGILAMLILPFLAWLTHGHDRGDSVARAVAEAVTVFIFWSIFLAATAKFSSSYHSATGWNNRCKIGFSMCSTGRALLAFGWITFGLLTALFLTVVARAVFGKKKEMTRDEQPAGGNIVVGSENRQVAPHSAGSEATAIAGKQHGGGETTGMTQVPQAQV